MLHVLSLTRAQPWSLAFSPNSRLLAVGTGWPEGAVRLWDMHTGQQSLLVTGNAAGWRNAGSKLSGWATGLAFSPDGKHLAVNGNGTLGLYDLTSGKRLWNLTNRNEDGTMLAFSPDGKTIANDAPNVLHELPTGPLAEPVYTQGQAQLLDASTGNVVAEFPNPTDVLVDDAAFSPDGHYLAVGSQMHNMIHFASVLCVYSLPDRNLAWKATSRDVNFNALRFSPDNRLIVAEGSQESLSVWDAKTGALLSQKPGHLIGSWSDSADVLAFTPDGRFLAHRQGNAVQVWQASALR